MELELVGNNLTYFALFFAILMMFLIMLACYICLLIRKSDRRKKYYLIDLAKRRGLQLDLESLRPSMLPSVHDDINYEHPCPIAVPDLGIFVS